ncbi:MAG: hypothetical protein NT027_19825, partial [Proteobacteria bacterium]|nr:hypothetical protein [Pseudomonadota bacterium]
RADKPITIIEVFILSGILGGSAIFTSAIAAISITFFLMLIGYIFIEFLINREFRSQILGIAIAIGLFIGLFGLGYLGLNELKRRAPILILVMFASFLTIFAVSEIKNKSKEGSKPLLVLAIASWIAIMITPWTDRAVYRFSSRNFVCERVLLQSHNEKVSMFDKSRHLPFHDCGPVVNSAIDSDVGWYTDNSSDCECMLDNVLKTLRPTH